MANCNETDQIIRTGTICDLKILQKLFVETILNVCKTDYDKKQLSVWASTVENEQRWENILTKQYVLVAQDKEKIIGFCTLDQGNHIDFLFVHRNYQRQGIARKLYTEIEKEAKIQKQTMLTSDVSKTARPFFEKIGFEVIKEQEVELKTVKLTNYKMAKKL